MWVRLPKISAACLELLIFCSIPARSATLITFVYYQQIYALPLRVVDHLGFSKADFALLLTLNGALVVILELPISSLTMHRNPRRMLALGFLLVGVGYALTGAATTWPMLAGTVVIWSFGEMIGAPVSYSYVADLAPPEIGGRYQGLFGLAWGTGAVTGPLLGGLLLQGDSMLFWPLLGVVGALAAAMVAAVRPRRWTEGTTIGFDAIPEAMPSPEGLPGEPFPQPGGFEPPPG